MMRTTVICIIFVLSFSTSYAQDEVSIEDQLQIVTDNILKVCRGGTLQGKHKDIELDVQGNVAVLKFLKIAEMGAEGVIKIGAGDWDGMKPILTADNNSSDAYILCVNAHLPRLLALYTDQALSANDIYIELSKRLQWAAGQFNTSSGICLLKNVSGGLDAFDPEFTASGSCDETEREEVEWESRTLAELRVLSLYQLGEKLLPTSINPDQCRNVVMYHLNNMTARFQDGKHDCEAFSATERHPCEIENDSPGHCFNSYHFCATRNLSTCQSRFPS